MKRLRIGRIEIGRFRLRLLTLDKWYWPSFRRDDYPEGIVLSFWFGCLFGKAMIRGRT